MENNVDIPIALMDSSDWFTIIRTDKVEEKKFVRHQELPNVKWFWISTRLNSGEACVEGNSQDMIHIMNAILNSQTFQGKRCAVKPVEDGFVFWSPRNSWEDESKFTVISNNEAHRFAQASLVTLMKA